MNKSEWQVNLNQAVIICEVHATSIEHIYYYSSFPGPFVPSVHEVVIKSMSYEVKLLVRKSWFHSLLAVIVGKLLNLLHLGFLIYKIGMIQATEIVFMLSNE